MEVGRSGCPLEGQEVRWLLIEIHLFPAVRARAPGNGASVAKAEMDPGGPGGRRRRERRRKELL